MNPQNPEDYNPQQRVSNELTVMQPDEQVICNIKRHPIGILTMYGVAGLMLIGIALLAFGLLPSLMGDNRSEAMRYGGIIFLLAAIFSGIWLLIATKVYWGNSWVVTSDSITQVNQTSLFDRQSSQLSLSSLEDITAEQNGPLCQMFNYGVLKAETAGEHSKFSFIYCPNPNYHAQKILAAREAFEQNGGHQGAASMPPPTINAE